MIGKKESTLSTSSGSSSLTAQKIPHSFLFHISLINGLNMLAETFWILGRDSHGLPYGKRG